jgi:hypothetical protein
VPSPQASGIGEHPSQGSPGNVAVDRDPASGDDRGQVAVHVDQAAVRDGARRLRPEPSTGGVAIDPVDPMHDPGLRLPEAAGQHLAQVRCFAEQVPRPSRSIPATDRSDGRPYGIARTDSTISRSDASCAGGRDAT